MEHLSKIKDNICKELERMSKLDSFNASSLDAIDKLTHSLKSIETIMAMNSNDYSNDYANDGYSRGYSGLENKVRGDRMRYSNYGYSRNYSNDRYSNDMLNLKSKLENMLQNAKNDEEYHKIKEWMQQL